MPLCVFLSNIYSSLNSSFFFLFALLLTISSYTFISNEWLLSQKIAVICFRILYFRMSVCSYFFFFLSIHSYDCYVAFVVAEVFLCYVFFLPLSPSLSIYFGGYDDSLRPHHHYHDTVCTLNNQQAYMRCVLVCATDKDFWPYSYDDDEVEIPRKNKSILFFSFVGLLSQKLKPNNESSNVTCDVYAICSAYNWTIQDI